MSIHVEPATPDVAKRRKVGKGQVASGVGCLVESSALKNRVYISKQLEGQDKDDLASMIADMLRDGD